MSAQEPGGAVQSAVPSPNDVARRILSPHANHAFYRRVEQIISEDRVAIRRAAIEECAAFIHRYADANYASWSALYDEIAQLERDIRSLATSAPPSERGEP